MVKWFCDRCHVEIAAPEHPERVRAYRCGVMTPADAYDNIGQGFYHQKCADALAIVIKKAFEDQYHDPLLDLP